jgi:diguanylate cyclase (GGDEF)-like protein
MLGQPQPPQLTRRTVVTLPDALRPLLDVLPVGVALMHDLRLRYCNAWLAAVLGHAQDQLTGRSARVLHASDAAWVAVERRCAAAMQAGPLYEEELPLQHLDGRQIACLVRVCRLDANRPSAGTLWMVVDVSAAHAAARSQSLQEQIQALQWQLQAAALNTQARDEPRQFDALTSLPNRAQMTHDAEQLITKAHEGNKPLALLLIDLDRFKYINDSLGHHVGDQLLAALAKRLRSAVRERDLVSRLGGDEFMLMLPDTDMRGAAHVAEKLMARVLPLFQIEQHELSITPSIGIAMYPEDGDDFGSLTQGADAAMYQAKRSGGGMYRFFTPAMQSEAARALTLENALRRALERQQLSLAYQPMIDLRSGQLTGVEALLRWQHPELGHISPNEFIPVAEACGLIDMIGEWALRSAAMQLRAWRDQGLPALTVAVNLSAMQLLKVQLPALVDRILLESGLGPQDLELELTEGAAMADPQRAIAVLDALHQRGIRVSIDDFGTGHSSLSYLKRFRAYKLKIDQSFVRDIQSSNNECAIVSAIIHMASSLGIHTIAEGVETETQLRFLRQQGCEAAQGFLFSRPLSATQLEAFVRDLQQA